MEKEYDAILRNWTGTQWGDVFILRGHIFEDSKDRFPDGEPVRTSEVETIKGGIAQTKNTRYLLE